MTNRSRTKAHGSSARREQPENSLQRMLEESEQRQAEVAALLEGSRAVLRYREFQEAARSIFDSCRKLVGATSGYVALLSKKGTENEVLFLDSGGLCCTVDRSLPMPIRGLRGEVYRSGKAVYCNDFTASEWVRFLPKGHVTLQNVLFAPLTVEDEVVGLLGIANKPGGFDDHDARIASAFGELAAIALLNSRTLESLENSEERFRSVTQSANDGIVSADCSGKIVFWNEAAAKMFGYSADEIIGKPLTLLMPGQFHEAHQKGMDRVVSTGKSAIIGKTIEVVGLRKDGNQFPIELSLGTWTTKEGTFFTGILRDVTERKQVQERNNAIIRTSMDGFWIIDLEGNILEVNDSYCQLVGYSRGELLSLNVRDLELVESPDEIRTHAQKVRDGGSDRFETRHRRKDGNPVDLEISANYLAIDGGRICTFFRDITERKRVEKEIARLAKFPSENPNPVLRISSDGTVLYSNKASAPLLEVWRCREGEVLSGPWRQFVLDALGSGESRQTELECDDRVFSLTFAPVTDWHYVNVYALDITERKQAEQTLQLSHRFLQITNRHSVMNPLLAEFTEEVKNFTGCAAVGIRVLDEQGNIPYQVNTGFSRDFCELESPLSIKTDHGMCINVIKGAADAKLPFYTQRGSFYINGTTQYLATVSPQQKGQTRDVCHEFGYESVALVPIRLGSRILGLIHVADPRENMLPLQTVEVLEGAALQLGAAIQRVRAEEALHKAHDELETKVRRRTAELAQANQALQAEIAERQRLEKEILRVSAQEQHRIGQELHDGLGQQLLGLGMMAKSLQKTLQARSLPEADSACEITEALIDAQNHVRAIIKGVYPVNVDANGLMAALADLAGSTQTLSEIPCTFVCDQPVPVEDNHTATQLFHIASEAVTNAVKHANAKHIAIGLGCDETKLTLWVRDDGVGIRKDPNQIVGMGLRIMRHRARVVGASLEIRAATGGGTLVACSLQREDGK